MTYTADVDWWAPEQASELAEYRQFAMDNAASIRASAVLHPTGTATVVRVEGARGGNVVTIDGPYAETKEALTGYYLIEDAVREATLAALGAWPIRGVPPEPRAWLTVTAQRKAIDILRANGPARARSWPACG